MKARFLSLLPLALIALLPAANATRQDTEYDIVVRNGRIADGTGNPAYFADLGIREGRVVRIGRIAGAGAKEIDATGKVVSPGFIDVHTHAENISRLPKAQNFARMGVTTIVNGNCGGSEQDLDAYFKRIDGNVALNVCSLVGHNTVRRQAMGGNFDREPTPAELDKMRAAVRKAMEDGAVGLSTGLIYLPGTYAKTDEIIELSKVAAQYDGIYASHMRSEGTGIFDAIEEVIRIAREAKIRAQISHIKLSGNAMWGRAKEVLALIEKARAEGLDITQDQYMYTASSTSLSTLIPSAFREGNVDFKQLVAQPAEKAKIVEAMKRGLRSSGRPDYGYAYVANFSRDRSYNGKSIKTIAKEKRGSDSLDDQIELILDIHLNGSGSGVFHGMSEPDLREFLSHPNTMIASDSGVRELGESVPHPRGYGNNARALGLYVRDEKVLRLEDAIRRMTSLPATAFRLKDRGLLREGAWADIVVFDPAAVRDPSTYDDPHHLAVGFEWVLVNGVPIVERGEQNDAMPGKALRLGR
jgi:N-acyl-D-amino-acid deacylase